MNNESSFTKIDPSHQLELLKLKCERLSPGIYRDHALYLQVLRDKLVLSVRKSIFELITHQNSSSYELLPISVRHNLQQKVEKLVSKCTSLLTVEHLFDLSRQIEVERLEKINQAKEDLINTINSQNQNQYYFDQSYELISSFSDDKSSSIQEAYLTEDLNDSIKLDLEENLDQEQNHIDIPSQDQTDDVNSSNSNFSDEQKNINKMTNDLGVLRSLFQMSGQSFVNEHSLNQEKNLSYDQSSHSYNITANNQGLLPNNPLALVQWIDTFQFALARRLRNLSYALNIELLRVGLINTLLPINLLDGVIAGQVESISSVSNILRLKVPVQNPLLDESVDICCILLRQCDLEFDEVHLRRCSSQIKKYRISLHKMVKQQRHWQSRYIAHKAHEQWWQNPPENPPENQ